MEALVLDRLVSARSHESGGPWFVELCDGAYPAVCLGPYENPAVAQRDAKKVRAFVAAILAKRDGEISEHELFS